MFLDGNTCVRLSKRLMYDFPSGALHMSNINPHKKSKALEKWKKILGQYKYERLCATIKFLEDRKIPYSISKLARMSRKELLRLRSQYTSVRADYRAKQAVEAGQPIPLKTASEFIQQ